MPQRDFLTDLLASLRLILRPATSANDGLQELLQEWKTFFEATMSVDTSPQHVATWESRLASMVNRPDRQGQLQLLKEASQDPLFGLSLVVAAIPRVMQRQVQAWWETLFAEQTTGGALAGWRIKTMPAPSPGASGPKYLILSDVHRDAASDDKGVLALGSIDHFKGNAALYERILQHAIDNGYTVLEAGDCEELWFVASVADYPKKADGTLDVAAKLSEIINSHPRVYDKLRLLHRQGRYVRIQGNHDSFVKRSGNDDGVGTVLRNAMQFQTAEEIARREPMVPFEVYDACIIDGVKTMMEKSASNLLGDALLLLSGQLSGEQFAERLLGGRLGLDSSPYADKCRMLVCHGHQFDFWNCPDNEILGMLIANTVGTFADRQMDPFLDARGIAWQGNPLVDFGDVFASLPVFDSWPERTAAVRLAHDLQHMPNSERLLNDNVMFFESVPAIFGGFGIALNHVDDHGREVTPEESRMTLRLNTPSGIVEYLKRHHLHHICIGHTHAPHSQPFFTLRNLGSLALPLAPVIALLRASLPDFFEPQVKTTYFNSGTAGWMDGVVWGVEIDETGQARLVFWTSNSIKPEYMDWELQPLPQNIKQQLIDGFTKAFNAPAGAVEQSVKDIYTRIKTRLSQVNASDEAIKDALANSLALPIHTLALSLMTQASDYTSKQLLHRRWELNEIGKAIGKASRGIEDAAERLERELEKLRSFTLDVFMSVKRRAFSGFSTTGEVETLSIRAPISQTGRESLDRFTRVFASMDPQDSGVLHCAAFAFSAFDHFPRHMPFFASMAKPLGSATFLHSSESPVLQAFLSTLWFYPRQGEVVNIRGVAIRSRFAVSGNVAHLSVELSASRLPHV